MFFFPSSKKKPHPLDSRRAMIPPPPMARVRSRLCSEKAFAAWVFFLKSQAQLDGVGGDGVEGDFWRKSFQTQ